MADHKSAVPSTQAQPLSHKPRKVHIIDRIGSVRLLILAIGTFVSLSFLAFIAFLWAADESNYVWQHIVLAGWTARAATLAALVIRSITTAQAAICTSILAAFGLKHYYVLLPDSAAVSLMQFENSGPQSLAIILLRTLIRGRGLHIGALVFLLLISTSLLQFSSTILLSDVKIGLVADFAMEKLTPYEFPQSPTEDETVLDLLYTNIGDYSVKKPAQCPRFAESREEVLHSLDGVYDTGSTIRGFLPILSQTEREFLKSYDGMASVLDSRVVCMRPDVADVQISLEPYTDPPPYLVGRVGSKLMAPRLEVVNTEIQRLVGAEDGLLPFNCATSINERGEWPIIFCHVEQTRGIISEMHVSKALGQDELADYILRGPAQSFLLINTTGSWGRWSAYSFNDTSIAQGEPPILPQLPIAEPASFEGDGEWLSVRTNDPLIHFSLSLCYTAFWAGDFPVNLSSPGNHSEPVLEFDKRSRRYNTDPIRHQLAATKVAGTKDSRGLFSFDSEHSWLAPLSGAIFNTSEAIWALVDATKDWYDFEAGGGFNISKLACFTCTNVGLPTNKSTYLAMEALQATLFNDILRDTNHPALAVQAHFTILFSMAYYDGAVAFDDSAPSRTVSFVIGSRPASWTGFAIVSATLAVHLMVVAIVMVLFTLKGENVVIGSAWAAIARLRGEEMERLTERAGLVRDSQLVEEMRRSGGDRQWVGLEGEGVHLRREMPRARE